MAKGSGGTRGAKTSNSYASKEIVQNNFRLTKNQNRVAEIGRGPMGQGPATSEEVNSLKAIAKSAGVSESYVNTNGYYAAASNIKEKSNGDYKIIEKNMFNGAVLTVESDSFGGPSLDVKPVYFPGKKPYLVSQTAAGRYNPDAKNGFMTKAEAVKEIKKFKEFWSDEYKFK